MEKYSLSGSRKVAGVMNILQLHERTEIKGGVEVYISQLQELLPKNQINTYWIGVDTYTDKFIISEYGNGVHLETNNLTHAISFLKNFIERNEIDIINVHNLFNVDILRFCLDNFPVIKSAHGPVMVCFGKDKFWRYSETPCTIPYGLHCFKHVYTEGCANRHPKRVIKAWKYIDFELKTASHKYKKIIVMSNYIQDGLIECGVSKTMITCNPYFTPRSDIHKPQGIKKSLLFVGRLISSKGPQQLIEALSCLLKKRDDIELNIVGDGLMKATLISKVNELGLSGKVIFHGWLDRPQTDKLLNNSYLVMFPSVYPEAFGIVGIEAMMRGKPVVGFNVGGVSTWLENGKTGFLVANKQLEEFAMKTEELLDNSLLYTQMSRQAYLSAVEKFLPEVHLSQLLATYKKSIA